jgi:hypothetical protein
MSVCLFQFIYGSMKFGVVKNSPNVFFNSGFVFFRPVRTSYFSPMATPWVNKSDIFNRPRISQIQCKYLSSDGINQFIFNVINMILFRSKLHLFIESDLSANDFIVSNPTQGDTPSSFALG